MRRDRFDRKVDRTVDSKVDTFERVEVITGVTPKACFQHDGRRRSWSAEAKARIVMETLREGAVVSDVARRHGMRPQQLFAWRKGMRSQLPAASSGPSAFAPVEVADAAPAPVVPLVRRVARPKHDRAADGALIEIAFGGTLIRVRSGVDGETLMTVLRAVKGAT